MKNEFYKGSEWKLQTSTYINRNREEISYERSEEFSKLLSRSDNMDIASYCDRTKFLKMSWRGRKMYRLHTRETWRFSRNSISPLPRLQQLCLYLRS